MHKLELKERKKNENLETPPARKTIAIITLQN
jgi:hypothetical protein